MMSEFLHDVHCLHSRVSSHQSCSHWTRMILKLVIFLSALLCNISCQYSDHCALMMPGTWFWIRSFSSIKTIDNFTFLMTLHRSFPSGRIWRNGVRWFQQRIFQPCITYQDINAAFIDAGNSFIDNKYWGLWFICRLSMSLSFVRLLLCQWKILNRRKVWFPKRRKEKFCYRGHFHLKSYHR